MAVRYKSHGDDVLAEVLDTLRLRSRVFCRSEFSAPWAIRLRASDYAHFHVVERGGGWIRLEGSREATALASGDLVIVPHGQGHTLTSSPSVRPVAFESFTGETSGETYVLRHGGGGAETKMICGSFEFDRMRGNPVLSILPPLVHVQGFGSHTGDRLEALLKLLSAEATEPRQGSGTIITRLTDVVFVHAVRAWLDEQGPGEGGWLGALRDPQIGKALSLIHAEPARTWSVASLAGAVGMSRSPFAERFRELVGEPPLSYVTRWRMQLVASMLRDGRPSLREMAERAGYESEPAFSKAFKRYFGVSPTVYRQRVQELAPGKAS